MITVLEHVHPARHRQAQRCGNLHSGCRTAAANGDWTDICGSCDCSQCSISSKRRTVLAQRIAARRSSGCLWVSLSARRAWRFVAAPRWQSPSPGRHGRRRTPVAQRPSACDRAASRSSRGFRPRPAPLKRICAEGHGSRCREVRAPSLLEIGETGGMVRDRNDQGVVLLVADDDGGCEHTSVDRPGSRAVTGSEEIRQESAEGRQLSTAVVPRTERGAAGVGIEKARVSC